MRTAIREAHEAISALRANGHAEGCNLLSFGNAECDCGVDAAERALAKLQPFIS